MNGLKLVVISVLLGVLVTLLTGYSSALQLMGATQYGFPAAWLVFRVLAPTYYPWFVNYVNFLIDVGVWSVISWIVLNLLLGHFAKGASKPKAARLSSSKRRSRRQKK